MTAKQSEALQDIERLVDDLVYRADLHGRRSAIKADCSGLDARHESRTALMSAISRVVQEREERIEKLRGVLVLANNNTKRRGERIAVLEKALRFYAEGANWQPQRRPWLTGSGTYECDSKVEDDDGDIARDALVVDTAGTEKETKTP